MPSKTLIKGKNDNSAEVENGGLVVSTQSRQSYQPLNIFLTDENGSPAMNVDGSVGGSTDGVHDGTDSVLWTGSAISGTWDFASTAQAKAGTKSIDASATTNGDQGLLTRGSSISLSGYSVITGSIYLDKFNGAKNRVDLTFRLSGSSDGSSVNIGDYIDTGVSGSWQDFVIPLTVFGVSGSIDELVITTINDGGTNPDYYLDELYLQQSGSITYKSNLTKGQIYQYNAVEYIIADAHSSVVTVAGATENTTGMGISYNSILGVAALTYGINIRRVNNKGVIRSGSIRSIGDMLINGVDIVQHLYDGANTFLKLRAVLPEWVTLHESAGDAVDAVVNDDLTGLLDFKIVLIGRELI